MALALPPPFLAIFRPSIRERLWQAIETQLATIHVDNGWPFTLHLGRRGNLSPLDLQSFPAAVLIPVTDEPDSDAYSTNRRILSFRVACWVRPHAKTAIQLEPVLNAVAIVMQQDPLWNRLADNTDEGVTVYVYVEGESEEACAEIEYSVQYRTRIEDPTLAPGEPQP
jgi:hypothetical protein